MAKKQKDMSWLLNDEETHAVDIVDANGTLLEN